MEQNNKLRVWIPVVVVCVIIVVTIFVLNGGGLSTETSNAPLNQIGEDGQMISEMKAKNNQIAEELGLQAAPGTGEIVIGTKNMADMRGEIIEQPESSTNSSNFDIKTITLTFGNNTITPPQFSVDADVMVTLRLTSIGDKPSYFFVFDDVKMSAISLGLSGKETREITFRTPSDPGSYTFHSDTPGHREMGYAGVMVVK